MYIYNIFKMYMYQYCTGNIRIPNLTVLPIYFGSICDNSNLDCLQHRQQIMYTVHQTPVEKLRCSGVFVVIYMYMYSSDTRRSQVRISLIASTFQQYTTCTLSSSKMRKQCALPTTLATTVQLPLHEYIQHASTRELIPCNVMNIHVHLQREYLKLLPVI